MLLLERPIRKTPNLNVCPICLGHPGCLPVPNKKAIEYVMRAGFALGGKVAVETKFDRKNYFYPDLPKGYQISQYDKPIVSGGYIDIEEGGEVFRIDIERIHLEEDTASLKHNDKDLSSLLDFNRSGVALMELVTKPVIKKASYARRFAEELRHILRYLEISDAELENGLMRVELNISIAKEGDEKLGTKVEIKNLNSLSVLEKAADYEVKRQARLLDGGGHVKQETRGWDEARQRTFSQRTKEGASDYRYFKDPDIPAFRLVKEEGFDRDEIRLSVPELPVAKRARFKKQYAHTDQEADIFVVNRELASYYENVISEFLAWEEGKKKNEKTLIKLATNYIIKNIRSLLDEIGVGIKELKITPENFAELIYLIDQKEVNSTAAREVLREMARTGADPSDIIESGGFKQENKQDVLLKFAAEVIAENEVAVEDYKKGKENAIKFLVGKLMAKSKGAANPKIAEEVLRERLKG